MIGAVPVQNALLMTGYGAGKRWSESNGSDESNTLLMGVFIGGCAGGVLQSFVMSPVRIDTLVIFAWYVLPHSNDYVLTLSFSLNGCRWS